MYVFSMCFVVFACLLAIYLSVMIKQGCEFLRASKNTAGPFPQPQARTAPQPLKPYIKCPKAVSAVMRFRMCGVGRVLRWLGRGLFIQSRVADFMLVPKAIGLGGSWDLGMSLWGAYERGFDASALLLAVSWLEFVDSGSGLAGLAPRAGHAAPRGRGSPVGVPKTWPLHGESGKPSTPLRTSLVPCLLTSFSVSASEVPGT